MPTHAPKPLVTHCESVSTFLSCPVPSCPRACPLSWVVSIPRAFLDDRGTSRGRLLYTGAISMALKPPFSSLYYCSLVIQGLGPSHGVAPSMVFPTHGYRGAALWSPCPCVIPSWRRPISATPYLGDAFSWRGLYLASPPPRRRLTLTLTLTLSTPGYGTVQIGRCMYNRMWLVV